MFSFKYTENELHHKYFPKFLSFVGILKILILRNSLQLPSTDCQDSLIKSVKHATLLLQVALFKINILLTWWLNFMINQASMNDCNYEKLLLDPK